MSSLVTLAEIKQRAREEADMENSGFIKDSELLSYINASAQNLYDHLIMKFGADYFVNDDPYLFTTDSENTPVDLPDDFYKCVGVDVKISNTEFVTMKPFMFAERNKYNNSLINGYNGFTHARYRIMGNKIRFMPRSQGGFQVQVWYIPAFEKLVSDTDTFDGINGYEEYVIVDAAIKMLSKEESDPSVLMARKAEILRHIQEIADNRDISMPQKVQDVRGGISGLYGEDIY